MRAGNIELSLCAAAGAAAAGLAWSKYERGHFVTEELVFSSSKIKEPAILVFLSDLHDNTFGEKNEKLLKEIKRIHPDAVLIGGDTMVTKPGRADLSRTKELLQGISRLSCPVFYANGNHEQRMQRDRGVYGSMYDEFRKLLEEYQVNYLQNKTVQWRDDIAVSGVDIAWKYYQDFHPDSMVPSYLARRLGKAESERFQKTVQWRDDIAVSGVDIAWKYYQDFHPDSMVPSYLARRLGKAESERFQILLAHSPLFFDAYAGWGADLSLAGHFHGGTIRLPGLGGVMTPQYQFFHPFCGGVFEQNGRWMLVSRGLGTHSINIRIGNRPQLAVIRLEPKS